MSTKPLRAIASPCVNVCMLHPESDLCIGCKRTVEEIGRWMMLEDPERQKIIDQLPLRKIA